MPGVWTPIQNASVPRAILPSNQNTGPFEIGGALYAILNRDPIAGPYTNRCYKSLDGGQTWAEVDGANRPTAVFHSAVFYPGAGSVIYYAYFDTALQTIRIKNFDTATDTWQPEIAGGPAASSMLYMTVLSTGDYVFEFGRLNGAILDCYYVVYSGGWGGAVVISSVAQRSTPAGIVLDAADLVHFFYVLATAGQLRHVGLPSGGPLGADQAVATVSAQYAVGVGVIWNGLVVFPFADAARNPCVAYGTPAGVAAPVWTSEVVNNAVSIRSGLIEDHFLFLLVQGANLNYFFIDDISLLPPGTLNSLYLAVNNGAGWGASSVYYTDAMLHPSDYLHNPDATAPAAGDLRVLVDRIRNMGIGEHGSETGYLYIAPSGTITVTKALVPAADPGLFDLQIDGVTLAAGVGNGGTTGPVIVAPGNHTVGELGSPGTFLADYTVVIGGDAAADGSIAVAAGENKVAIITNTRRPGPGMDRGGSRRMVVLVPNRFDLALHQETAVLRRYRPQKSCCVPILWRDVNWVRAPADYEPFRKTAAIPTPLAASGDVVVLEFQVPDGYDGLIAGLYNIYTGPGFREGNGDIEWRVLINRVYAVQLGRILVTLGRRQKFYPVDGGIQIQSGTWVRYIVSVPNLSGGILPLASQIACGLEGLFYARA